MTFSVSSETGRLRDVLLCPPDGYRWIPTNAVVEGTIAEGGQADPVAVRASFGELVSALEGAGVRCHLLDPEPHLPYQVYTRDSSQLTPWGPVLTTLRVPQRWGERASVLRFYEAAGQPFWRYASAGSLEGGDIAVIRPGLLAIGVSGVRTDLDGARQLAGWFEAEGWEVRLVRFPEHFLHLDLLFCMAAPGLAVANREVLADDDLAWLAERGIRTIPVGYRDTMAMGCNLLALGDDRVVSPRHCSTVNAALRAEGLEVLDPDLEVFARGGGSVHCMTQALVREEP